MQGVVIVHADDCRRGQHGVVCVDVSRILGRLLYGCHFLLAASVVERADYDWLAEENVFGRCHVSLYMVSS